MINEQKQKIKLLRYQGIGYKPIANAIGLSGETVRELKRNKLHGLATGLVYCKREWEKIHRRKYTFTCKYCGKEFKSLGPNHRKYCDHNGYTKDRFWREEDAADVVRRF